MLVWLTALQEELGGEVSDEKLRDYIWNTLKSGRVRTIYALWMGVPSGAHAALCPGHLRTGSESLIVKYSGTLVVERL